MPTKNNTYQQVKIYKCKQFVVYVTSLAKAVCILEPIAGLNLRLLLKGSWNEWLHSDCGADISAQAATCLVSCWYVLSWYKTELSASAGIEPGTQEYKSSVIPLHHSTLRTYGCRDIRLRFSQISSVAFFENMWRKCSIAGCIDCEMQAIRMGRNRWNFVAEKSTIYSVYGFNQFFRFFGFCSKIPFDEMGLVLGRPFLHV